MVHRTSRRPHRDRAPALRLEVGPWKLEVGLPPPSSPQEPHLQNDPLPWLSPLQSVEEVSLVVVPQYLLTAARRCRRLCGHARSELP